MNGEGSSSSSANATATDMPEFNSVPAEKWVAGEAPISKVLSCVRPTLVSEDTRNAVVEYMRRLIKNVVGVEVLQYGSVPLKTYLPDGDIDITIFSIHEPKRNFSPEVLDLLLAEQQNGNNGFKIKEIRFIDAEVKLVKCLVNDMTIDVSFNQLSGLCALSFLERVDELIGNDHLFKRSVILIKSWCYYESRILGATHGLLSTYALETLVLCIFRMYNTSLTSPLKVLYMFLEYYSKFDWDNFCIGVDGPVNKSSLPNIVDEDPVNNRLFDEECMRDYINLFTLPCKKSVKNPPPFALKFINIIDTLKVNNNLGRSVHTGTCHRIKYALAYGAHKFGQILELPIENIQEGIMKFFRNTMERNQSTCFLNPRLTFETLWTNPITEVHYEDESDYESEYEYEDENSNADNDNGKSLERNDLPDLCLVPDNEEGGENANTNGGHDNGNGEFEATGRVDESDNLTLADLSGDFYGSVRNLVISECYEGFPKSYVIVHDPAAGYATAVGFQQNSPQVQPFPHGSVMPLAPSFAVHGALQCVPPTDSPRAYGRGHVAPISTRQLNPTHQSTYETGSSSGANSHSPHPQSPQGASSHVRKERKLEFGSFGQVSVTNSEPAETETYSLCGGRQSRVPDKTLSLKDESEFPPLSA